MLKAGAAGQTMKRVTAVPRPASHGAGVHFPSILIGAIMAAVLGAGPARAQDNILRGHALLQAKCSTCHAVDRTGASPHHLAPPFRTLGQRYPIESLEEALGEGILSGHPDMPEFRFEPSEVGDIIAYLKSIQTR